MNRPEWFRVWAVEEHVCRDGCITLSRPRSVTWRPDVGCYAAHPRSDRPSRPKTPYSRRITIWWLLSWSSISLARQLKSMKSSSSCLEVCLADADRCSWAHGLLEAAGGAVCGWLRIDGCGAVAITTPRASARRTGQTAYLSSHCGFGRV